MRNKLFLYTLICIIFSCTAFPISVFAGSDTVYTAASSAEIENIIFNAIKNREETFKIRYSGNTGSIMSDIREARDRAVKRDPYEEGCISLISGFTVSDLSDHADIYFDSFKYYTTKAQETYVDQKIQEIVSKIVSSQMSDNQKEKAIHDYIISHVRYDNTLSGYTAYSALHEGSTVCNGFVQLAYRLLTSSGIETKIVKGRYNSIDHEWNLVRVKNHWYHLDCTLNDTLSSSGNPSYRYYNLSDSDILTTHQYDRSDYPAADTKYKFLPVSIRPFDDVKLSLGSVISLPGKAAVLYEDESTSEESITWDSVDAATLGTKTATGTVSVNGITLTAKVKVIVTSDSPPMPAPITSPAPASGSSSVSLPGVEPSVTLAIPPVGEITEVVKYKNTPQAKDKIWTIKFNQEIDFDTVNPNTVLVVDFSGNIVEGVSFKRGASSNVLLIQPPASGYHNGKSYYLYILKGVFSNGKKGLAKAVKIPFTVED